MDKYMNDHNSINVKRPPFSLFPFNTHRITDAEYMRLVFGFSKNCGIEWKMDENEERYRFDFYLHESVIDGKQISEWTTLIEESDMHIMTVLGNAPQTIRASFYRVKQKNVSSK